MIKTQRCMSGFQTKAEGYHKQCKLERLLPPLPLGGAGSVAQQLIGIITTLDWTAYSIKIFPPSICFDGALIVQMLILPNSVSRALAGRSTHNDNSNS